jgi:peptidoglycan/LPS O-acetylase OafA/YrhL
VSEQGLPRGQDEGLAPAGWYADPRGSGNLLYWDGTRWTGDVHSTPKPAAGRPSYPRSRASMVVVGGGAALAISPFLTWVQVILLGNLSLFQLFTAAGRSSALAWGAVVAGAAAAIVALRNTRPSTVRGTALAVGLLGGALAVYALVVLRHELRDAHGLAVIGIGPYIAIAGCIAMVAGALISKREERLDG